MADTSGYYKIEDKTLLYGLKITNKAYALSAATEVAAPGAVVDGWQWFKSVELACEKYGVKVPVPDGEPTPGPVPDEKYHCTRVDCKERVTDGGVSSGEYQ